MRKDDAFLNRVGGDRISSRQIDELMGLARGICADGVINELEAEFLQNWLAHNQQVSDQPLIRDLFTRVTEMLDDGHFDRDERAELLETLQGLAGESVELGEVLRSATLPLCDPAPILQMEGSHFCFTGTFTFGQRKLCEAAVRERGGEAGPLRKSTEVLVIGSYATESWKHSSMGNKIMKAVDWRADGHPISIVGEAHWRKFL